MNDTELQHPNPNGRLAVYANKNGAYSGGKVVAALNDIIAQTKSYYPLDNEALSLKRPRVVPFPNTMQGVMLDDMVRGEDAYVIQWFPRPPGDTTLELSALRNKEEFFHTVRDLMMAGAKRLTLVTPYAYDQRKDVREGRDAVGAATFCEELKGVTHGMRMEALCLDIHAQQIVGMYQLININLSSVPIFETYANFLKTSYSELLENGLVVMPDIGSSKRGRTMSEWLQLPRVIFDKYRTSPTESVSHVFLERNVKLNGKTILIFDDVLGTGGTAADASREMLKREAKEVYWFMTHLEGTDMGKLDGFYKEGLFKSIFVADTIKPPRDYFIEVPTAPLMARLIYNIHTDQSIGPYMRTKPNKDQ